MRSLAAKVFLIFLLAAGTAFGQDFHLYGFSMYNLEFLGTGARARSMGGAFVGIADDASALTWNPAGLIQISKAQASVGGSIIRLKTKNDVKYDQAPNHSFATDYTKDLLNLASGSFLAPVRIKGHPFVAAVNYQRVIDDNDEVDNRQEKAVGVITTSGSATGVADWADRNQSLRNLHKFALGFGTDIYEKLSFGSSVNIYYGGGTNEYYGSIIDTLPYIFGSQVIDTVEVRGVSSVRDKLSSSSVNLTGSLMYRTEKFRAGISIQSPFELVTEHDIKRADTIYLKSTSTPGPGSPIGGRPTLYIGKTKIEIPLTIGLGASMQVTPKFLISGDLEMRSTSGNKYFVRAEELPTTDLDAINSFTLPSSIYFRDSTESSYYDASGTLVEIYNEFELSYESSMQVRFGAEYMLATSIGTIPLRGGLRFTQLPYRDVKNVYRDAFAQADSGFVLGDKLSQTSFTFGSGIHWTQVWLDFVVEMNKQEQTESGISIFSSGLTDYNNARIKETPTFMLSFTGFF